MSKTETQEEKEAFTAEIMVKLNQKDDESNWGTLLLSLAFLASLVFLSLLLAACLLPRADPISHTHMHKHAPVGQLQFQSQNILHMATFSPPSPRLFSSCSLSLSPRILLSLVLSKYSDSHGHSHKHSPEHEAHTDSCACTDRRRDGKVVILQDAGENRGRVGKE